MLSRVLATIAICLAPLPAVAQNLVQNARFDANLAQWTSDIPDGTGSVEWAPADANGAATSGSALLRHAGPGYTNIHQCVPVTPGASYTATLSYRADGPDDYAAFGILWAAGGCSGGTSIGGYWVSRGRAIGSWDALGGSVVVPAGVQYAYVTFSAADDREGATAVSFDDVFFGTYVPPCYLSCTASAPASGVEMQTLLFEASASTFGCTGPVSYTWDFGDGMVTPGPSAQHTYTIGGMYQWKLTASIGDQVCQKTGTVEIRTPAPEVVVAALPGALLQGPDTGGATTALTLANGGTRETQVTLTGAGDFFTISPSAFALPPGGSVIVTLTGLAKPAGSYSGTIAATGAGVPAGLTIPVRMLVASPPQGQPRARADENRVDLSAPAGQEAVDGEARFTNVGSGPLTALAVADVPWLSVSAPLVTIEPGATAAIPFTIHRSKRNDAEAPFGSVTGSLALHYVAGSGAGAAAGLVQALAGGVQVSTTLVTVTDTPRPRSSQGTPLPLRDGELAIFLASVGHVQSPVGVFVSDVQVSSLVTRSDVSLAYTAAGLPLEATRAISLPLTSAQPLGFSDVTRTIFEQESGLGTLQLRGDAIGGIEVGASVFNKSNAVGTYGSSVPALRSDRAIGPGETIVIPGVIGSSSAGRTNLIVQETSGRDALVAIDLLAVGGSVIASRQETVPAFQHLRLNDFAPSGTVAATIRLRDGSAGRVLAYATPVDALSGDTWVVADWPRVFGYDSGARQIIPIAGRILGGNDNFFRTTLAITNSGTTAATPGIRFVSNLGTTAAADVSIAPAQTQVWNDLLSDLLGLDGGVGYLEIDPRGASLAVTSRTFATIGDDPKTFGTGVPPVAASTFVTGTRRISGFDDADLATVQAKLPATFRTNVGLVETSGRAVTVRLTLHFRHPQGTRLVTVGSASREIQLAPNQFLLLQNVSREILGSYRDALQGNLKDLFLDLEIVGGDGAVVGFASSVDNGSSDQLFKLE